MNKERRKLLSAMLEKARDVIGGIDEAMSQEQDAFDNLPEGLQGSTKGEAMEEAISTMEDAMNDLYEAVDKLEQVIGS